MRDVQAFIADMKGWDDFTLIAAATLRGVVTRHGPAAKAVDKALRAEVRRRRLGGQVTRMIAAAKAEAERTADQTVTAYLPDGSAVLRMPGATATVRKAPKDPSAD
jgi:hypothetical protein